MFVTGGASGIGLAIAEKLVAAGARVALPTSMQLLSKQQLRDWVRRAIPVVLDVRYRGGQRQARARLETRFGAIDILINNAGIGPDGHSLADMDPTSFDRVIAINLTGAFNGVATFAASMRECWADGWLSHCSRLSLLVPAVASAVLKYGQSA